MRAQGEAESVRATEVALTRRGRDGEETCWVRTWEWRKVNQEECLQGAGERSAGRSLMSRAAEWQRGLP